MISLSVTDLHKSYGTQPVLRGLTVEVAAGSFTSILGPSGSGKTTLLRVIAGFERTDHGEVRIGEHVVDDGSCYVPPDRRRIGYVPQEGSLFPHLTVDQNVKFGLSRKDRDAENISELLALVGLNGLGGRYPHQLSGGQQQRVALARALAIKPGLVLLDEPFSSLDTSLRASVRHDVRRVLQSAGATVVLVTHDQDEALSLSDRVAVIESGTISQYGTPSDLYTHPLTPALARGFGETNFLYGTACKGVLNTPLGPLTIDAESDNEAVRPDDTPSYLVLIRPEQLVISPDTDGSLSSAHVIGAEFYGHDAVVHLRGDWAGTPMLTSRISDARHIPKEGTRVALSVRGPVTGWRKDPTDSSGATIVSSADV